MMQTNYRTKYHLENKMKYTHKTILPLLFILISYLIQPLSAQSVNTEIPEKPSNPTLVTDMTGLLSSNERDILEQKLVEFNNTTSTQIAVVIVKSLNGYEVGDMATRIIEKWGIGQKDKNNGILILIKPKTADERGQIAISTGYGLEHLVTDALSKRIVDNEMIPYFKQNAFYQGIDKAVNTLSQLTRGEYTADQYMAKTKKKGKKGNSAIFIIIIIIVVIVALSNRGKGGSQHLSSGSSLPFWLLMGAMNSGRGGGSFGDFGSGGGGFGGFGGGSGGGGGASGSW
jgi:uncharacterized protein